jgi:hypothetical protein
MCWPWAAVIQEELQPINKMHIYRIPWPVEVLRELGNEMVTLRATLSYFVEPGPDEIGWQHKYRYPSCGLRFDVINQDETEEDFKKRINVAMRGENRKDKGEGGSGSTHWYLGSENRDVGLIHSDFRTQYAIDLCNSILLAVYPVVGWWRERRRMLEALEAMAEKNLELSTFMVHKCRPVGEPDCAVADINYEVVPAWKQH